MILGGSLPDRFAVSHLLAADENVFTILHFQYPGVTIAACQKSVEIIPVLVAADQTKIIIVWSAKLDRIDLQPYIANPFTRPRPVIELLFGNIHPQAAVLVSHHRSTWFAPGLPTTGRIRKI